jgi:hypothetical protein
MFVIGVCKDLEADFSRNVNTDRCSHRTVMSRCRQPFPSGQRVTYTGKEVLCQKCVQIPVRETQALQASPSSTNGPGMHSVLFYVKTIYFACSSKAGVQKY